MNPIFANIIKIAPMLLNTGLSLIRDKKQKVKSVGETLPETDTTFVHKDIAEGISLSSKRILNITGTAIIITVALANIEANGLTKYNLILVAIGVTYSAGMALITYLSEKK